MTQKIEDTIWKEFEKEINKESEAKSRIVNSERPETEWMRKVTEKIRISDLAAEAGVGSCPKCDYDIYFDDTRGFFCCARARWTKKQGCNFAGNIVDFEQFIQEGR